MLININITNTLKHIKSGEPIFLGMKWFLPECTVNPSMENCTYHMLQIGLVFVTFRIVFINDSKVKYNQ